MVCVKGKFGFKLLKCLNVAIFGLSNKQLPKFRVDCTIMQILSLIIGVILGKQRV